MHFHQHVLKLNYKDEIEKEKKSNEHNNPKLKSAEKQDKKYQSTTTNISPYYYLFQKVQIKEIQ
jgi:hypothetical protein